MAKDANGETDEYDEHDKHDKGDVHDVMWKKLKKTIIWYWRTQWLDQKCRT